MIRPQRRRHLLIWLILGPAILIGLVIGLSVRRPIPVQSPVPDTVVEKGGLP